MYTLHIANKNYSSWSLRPWALMRMLEIPFREEVHLFVPAGSSFDLFRTFSPTGRVPCLVDDGWAVWDSLAIAEYLAERHAGVWPQDARARAWARSAAAEMHSGFSALRNECGMSCGVRVRLTAPSAALRQDVVRLSELWNEGFDRFGGPFLAGERFTAADAFYAPVAFRAQSYGLAFEGAAAAYPALLLDLAPMRQWYTDGLAETARDEAHDAEAAAVGVIEADLRATA